LFTLRFWKDFSIREVVELRLLFDRPKLLPSVLSSEYDLGDACFLVLEDFSEWGLELENVYVLLELFDYRDDQWR